jgi:two-component sensor histidine kinase
MARADGPPGGIELATTALRAAGMAGWLCVPDTGEMAWSIPGEAPACLGPGLPPSTLSELVQRIDERDRAAFELSLRRAWKMRAPLFASARLRGAADEFWIAMKGETIPHDSGFALTGVLYALANGERHAEHLKALIKELNHRVKNILISIGAIAAQSIKPGQSLENYVDHLRGRIRALSSVHDILVGAGGRGVPLRKVAEGEIAIAADEPGGNISILGEDILLKPRAGQCFALALHELTANSVKFGALSWRGGRIAIGWEAPTETRPAMVLTWEETGFGPLPKERTPSFGSVVLKELLPQEIDAAVSYEVTHNLVRCIVVAPAEWIVKSDA